MPTQLEPNIADMARPQHQHQHPHHHNHQHHHQHQHLHHLQSQHPHQHQLTTTTRLNSERRKEKAKHAARVRRSQEAEIFTEMAKELCISQEQIQRIDKASIVKFAIDYISIVNAMNNYKTNSVMSHQNSSCNGNNGNNHNNSNNNNNNNNNTIANNNNRTNNNNKSVIHSATRQIDASLPEPQLCTEKIFAPKTEDMNSCYLMINDGATVLLPDTQIEQDDDLTHLAPQAGDVSVPLDVEPLDGIILDQNDIIFLPEPIKIPLSDNVEVLVDGDGEVRTDDLTTTTTTAANVTKTAVIITTKIANNVSRMSSNKSRSGGSEGSDSGGGGALTA